MYNVIQFEDVSLQLKNKQILKNISLSLETNKIYGLLGRNGAGKTSLLSLLASFAQATSGRVAIDGVSVFENENLMENIIFIRDIKLDESEKVWKYIKQTAAFRPNFDEDYAKALMQRFRLPEDVAVSSLSRGMMSAMHVVIGLASRCAITIFDEAYLGMDAPARVKFYEEVLNDYMEHPRTIILSTHLISEMESMFEGVIIIDQGEIVINEDLDTFTSRGVTVTGPIEEVDAFTIGKTVLKEQVLGNTKQAMVYGQLSEEEKQRANGLQLAQITLQELFIHLTKEES